MAEINDLNVTDASNTARHPEKQAPSTINDGVRALEGILARGLKDTIDSALASGGSSSDYTVSANRTIGSYYDGLTIVAELNHTNDDTAVTLNVDSVGAGTVLCPDGSAPAIGALVAGGKYVFRHDGANWQVSVAPAATTSLAGVLETATDAEAIARSATDKILTPSNLAGALVCRIKTGTYTGDGTTSQGVTGVGFAPKYVKIWPRSTSDGTAGPIFETTDTIVDDNASGGSWAHSGSSGHTFEINQIISLDSDGFTVDDAGVDGNPNANGTVYNYLAIG